MWRSQERIEKEWLKEQDTTKELSKDAVLNESAAVVADLAEIEAGYRKN